MNFKKRYAIIAVSMAGAWFGFANPVWHLPLLALLFPMGMFLLALYSETPRAAFRTGLMGGLLVYAASLYWVAMPVANYGGLAWPLAMPTPVLLAFALGLLTGLFCYGIRLVKGRLNRISMGIFAGVLWGLMEALRGTLFTGFPWLVLPEAFSPWIVAVQGVAVVGVYGLAAVMVMGTTYLTMVFLPGKSFIKPLVAAVIVAGLIVGYGIWRLDQPATWENDLNVSIVQGNVEQSQKWEEEYQNATLELYLDLTRQEAEEHGAKVVVWPETSMPFFFQEETPLSQAVRDLAASEQITLLVGSPGYEIDRHDHSYVLYNRAYLVNERGEPVVFYDKEHLVPFGEYIPFKDVLFFLDKIVEGIGDFGPGLKTGPLSYQDMDYGMLICYEAIFPVLAQKRVENGADVLVNISNDAWFGPTSGPLQHLDLSLLRAIEQNRYMIRATNTGVSAIIDPWGRILAKSEYGTVATLNAMIGTPTENTIYHRIHWFVLPVLSGLVLLFLVFAMFKHPREG